MPRFDATGPLGFGPGTGRGMGPCGTGMGCGRVCGFGRFWGYNSPYSARITKEEEVEMLNNETKTLEEGLKAIQERLTELKSQK